LIDWFWEECPDEYKNRGELCQCQTEKLIARSTDPEQMRAFLMVGVTIDQMMYTHCSAIYESFRQAFRYPKVLMHPRPPGGMASPSWFVYSRHGFDLKMNWRRAENVSHSLFHALFTWLQEREFSTQQIGMFLDTLTTEIIQEFEPHNAERFISILPRF